MRISLTKARAGGLSAGLFALLVSIEARAAVDAADYIDLGDHPQADAGGGLPQFDPSTYTSQIFWLILTFVVMYMFFSNRTLPEISSVLENRREHIQSDRETAEKLRQEAERAQQDYESGLHNARIESSSHIAETTASLKAKAEQQATDFRSRAEQEIHAVEARIKAAKDEAMEEMNSIAAEVASEAAKKIVGIDTDIQKAQTVVKSLNRKEAA